jgi:hypothetical protein
MLTKDAIRFYGSVTALAKALGISRAAIYQWGDAVPESSSWKLQALSDGKLMASAAVAPVTKASRVVVPMPVGKS